MTNLTIARLSATARRVPDGPDPAPRIAAMLANLAADRLDAALVGVDLPAGEWLVRRLDVTVPLDLSAVDGELERQWAGHVLAALRAALADGGAVHYATDLDALVDVLAGCATRVFDRSWAWGSLGLTGADPAADPARAALTALDRHPHLALAALGRVADRTGWPALHRLFGARDWPPVADLVCRAHTGAATDWRTPGSPTGDGAADRARAVVRGSALAGAVRRSRLRVDAATARAWAVLVVADAEPGALARHAADGVLARVADLLTDPAGPVARHPGTDRSTSLDRSPARDHGPATDHSPVDRHDPAGDGAAVRAGSSQDRETWTSPDAAGSTGDRGVPDGSGPTDRMTSPVTHPPAGVPGNGPEWTDARPRPDGPTRNPDAPAGPEPADRDGAPTVWAGLLFLLGTATAAGVPAVLLDDPALTTRPLPWVLHALGRLLVPAAADDPAVLALAGLSGPAGAPDGYPAGRSILADQPPADPREQAALRAHAHRWAEATATRLHPGPRADIDPGTGADPGADPGAAPDPGSLPEKAARPPADPMPVDAARLVREVAARPGVIVADRGWTEVRLALDGVDVDVRRAGLDVDPGWVPWLGTVVVFRYV
ncbi:hypothetical protein R8Z50_13030 [Longispora sp. K20-0274]|uniref:hypothetical protein n=1 Tax=Longispora sp. K20-0274 TaxID=3088255 RepID=UPI00399BD1DA